MKSTSQLEKIEHVRAVIAERLNAATSINEALITNACDDPEAPTDLRLLDAMAIVLGATRRKVDRLERLLLDKNSTPRKPRVARGANRTRPVVTNSHTPYSDRGVGGRHSQLLFVSHPPVL